MQFTVLFLIISLSMALALFGGKKASSKPKVKVAAKTAAKTKNTASPAASKGEKFQGFLIQDPAKVKGFQWGGRPDPAPELYVDEGKMPAWLSAMTGKKKK